MNAVKIDKNRHKESTNMKVDAEEENANATPGKPCIDFEPGDRWQLKEEDNNGSVSPPNKNSKKRKSRSRRRNNSARPAKKDKVSTEVNGDVTAAVEDASDEDVEEEMSAEQSVENNKDKDKKEFNITSKSNDEQENSESGCTNGDDHAQNRKRRHSPSNENSESKKNKCDSASKEDLVENNGDASDLANASEKSEKCPDEKEKSAAEKDEGIKVESSSDKCASTAPNAENEMSDVTSSEKTESVQKKKDSENLIVVSDGESDNEIQVISSSGDAKKEDPNGDTKKPPVKSVADFSVSHDEETLMSAGFPYLISLQEKIKDLQPGKYNPVKFPHMGTLMLEENEVIIESPSLLVPLLIKNKDKFPFEKDNPENGNKKSEEKSKPMPGARKNFFQSSVGQFLINLGASRVLEWHQRDVRRSKIKQTRKLGVGYNKELEEEIIQLGQKHQSLKEANAPFQFPPKRCEMCEFKTESALVMEQHNLVPHMTPRREFKCNFCRFVTRDSKEILIHFKELHNKRAFLEDQMSLHECLFCSFQSHLKAKVSVHMNRCKRNFVAAQNLSPPFDFEFPGVTTKPVTITDVIAHRKMLMGTSKGVNFTNPGQSVPMESLASAFARKKLASVLNMTGAEGYPDSPTLVKHLMSQQIKQGGAALQLPAGLMLTRPKSRSPQLRPVAPNLQPRLAGMNQSAYVQSIGSAASQLASSGISITPVGKQDASSRITSSANLKNITLTPISSAGNQIVSQKPGPPQPVALFTNVAGNDPSRKGGPAQPGRVQTGNKPQRIMPPYQRLNTPPSQVVKSSSGSSFVMCEICDSYIKDLDELRSHMNWVHKVKIHPKMLVSRPPLNCQKCQWRFFTDQGLERHLLGAHGLVTTNMQEMANKNQDGGRCIICGAVFTYKLVSHMTQVHKVTLKPAHLSYKCTVCTATFTLYRLFESHVYNVHSSSSKRSTEESSEKKAVPKEKAAAPTPAAAAATTTTTSSQDAKKDSQKKDQKEVKKPDPSERVVKRCKDCNVVTEDLMSHIKEKHMKELRVKLCRIEKCQKCLYSTDEMLVIRLDQLGLDEDSSDGSSSSDDDEEETCKVKGEEKKETKTETKDD